MADDTTVELSAEAGPTQAEFSSREVVGQRAKDLKSYLHGIYPYVVFSTEREYFESDPETVLLYNDLVQIGQVRKDKNRTPEEAERLKQEWSAKVKERQKQSRRVEFDFMDFKDLDLSDVDLSGISFQEANFENSNLSNANLKQTVLVLGNFRNSILDDASLENAFVISADFTSASLKNTNMNANFAYSDFTGATIKPSDLNPYGLFGVKTTNATVGVRGLGKEFRYPETPVETKTQEALEELSRNSPNEIIDQEVLKRIDSLIGNYQAQLTQGKIETGEDSRNLYLELKKLGQFRPEDAKEVKAIRRAKRDWARKRAMLSKPINFDGLDLSNLDLSHVYLGGISLVGTNFENTNLEWSNLTGTDCALANFRNANLHMANMRGSFPIGADFSGTDLSAARLRETVFVKAKFKEAKIEYTDFKRCVILGAEFTDVSINDSGFDGCYGLSSLRSAKAVHATTF